MTNIQPAPQAQPSSDEPFERIGPEQAKMLLEGGDAVLIDVREPSEWAEVRIPGAKHVPLAQLLQNPADYVTQDNVVFSCSVGVRSAIACEMAAAIGRQRLYNLEGGITAWEAKGHSVER